jgi:hypothetical protein
MQFYIGASASAFCGDSAEERRAACSGDCFDNLMHQGWQTRHGLKPLVRASDEEPNVVRLRDEIFRAQSQWASWKTMLTLFPTNCAVVWVAGLGDAGGCCHVCLELVARYRGVAGIGGGEVGTVMTGGDEYTG